MVSVVVVTAGIGDYLKACLNSLKLQTYQNLEILVIDNSESGHLREVSLGISEAPIKFYSQGGSGYGSALNKGIAESKGEFILCLNDDVTLDSNFIQEALRGFFVGPRIGMVSGKILRTDGKTIDSAGLFLTRWRTTKERGYGRSDKGQFEREEYVFGVNGAVAFYRRAMLEELKIASEYFDSDFGFFYEDLDISWRARNLGWQCYYIPKAVGYHRRGGSLRDAGGIGNKFARHYLSDDLHFDLIKNRYLCIIKNEKFLNLLLHLALIVLYDVIVLGYTLIFRPSLIKKILLKPIPIESAFRKRKLLKNLKKLR